MAGALGAAPVVFREAPADHQRRDGEAAAKGWTREQAADAMALRLSLSRPTIEAEVDRYIAMPAQTLAYQIGKLQFRRLRARAQAALGERFNLRAWHDMLMATGPVALPVLAELVDDWLAQQPIAA